MGVQDVDINIGDGLAHQYGDLQRPAGQIFEDAARNVLGGLCGPVPKVHVDVWEAFSQGLEGADGKRLSACQQPSQAGHLAGAHSSCNPGLHLYSKTNRDHPQIMGLWRLMIMDDCHVSLALLYSKAHGLLYNDALLSQRLTPSELHKTFACQNKHVKHQRQARAACLTMREQPSLAHEW